MYVIDKINSDYDAIIGVDGLKAFDIVLNFSENKVIYGARCESAEVNAIKEETKPISAIKEERKPTNLTETQKAELKMLLEEYADLFEPIKPGSAHNVHHDIPVDDNTKPIFRRPYTLPFSNG